MLSERIVDQRLIGYRGNSSANCDKSIAARRFLEAASLGMTDQGVVVASGRWHAGHRDPSAARSLRQDDMEKKRQ